MTMTTRARSRSRTETVWSRTTPPRPRRSSSVTFDEGWISYEDEKKAIGEGVEKVEGLGREAWIGLGAIHVDLGEDNEWSSRRSSARSTTSTVIEGERYALAKLVVGRL